MLHKAPQYSGRRNKLCRHNPLQHQRSNTKLPSAASQTKRTTAAPLRDSHGDPLGKQVTDLMSKALTETNAYIVLERPDISRIQAEGALTGVKQI